MSDKQEAVNRMARTLARAELCATDLARRIGDIVTEDAQFRKDCELHPTVTIGAVSELGRASGQLAVVIDALRAIHDRYEAIRKAHGLPDVTTQDGGGKG